jgi:hypothetical protein
LGSSHHQKQQPVEDHSGLGTWTVLKSGPGLCRPPGSAELNELLERLLSLVLVSRD